MNLKKYDEKCVRITCDDGNVFEGISLYSDSEYNECEYNRKDESLDIENFKFYKSYIKKVENLENHNGPYGKFTDKYGTLEKMNVEDGIDTIVDILFGEEDEHIYRMLICLEDYFNNNYDLDYKKLKIHLEKLLKYYTNPKIIEEAKKLIELI